MISPISPLPEDQYSAADHVALHIQITLRRTRRKHSGRPVAGNRDCPARSFAAAHCQHDRLCPVNLVALRLADGMNLALRRYRQHHCVKLDFGRCFFQQLQKAPGIFGACQLFFKVMQPETVVRCIDLECPPIRGPVPKSKCSALRCHMREHAAAQTGRSAADYNQIVKHGNPLLKHFLFSPIRISLPSKSFFTDSGAIFSSRERISTRAARRSSLTPSHSGVAAAFDPVHAAGRDRRMNGVKNFALGNGFAAADHTAVKRIFGNHRAFSGFILLIEMALLPCDNGIAFFVQEHSALLHHGKRLFGNGRRRGKPR